jgi:guanine deaminase
VIGDALIEVDAIGTITAVHDLSLLAASQIDALLRAQEVLIDATGSLILPGFVDGHAHAPQYAFTGTGIGLPLLEWLETHAFPCEARFSDPAFARHIYEKAVQAHLQSGTTTVSYFASVHLEASKVLVDVVREAGQRAHVGKVSMDRNSPPALCETTAAAVADATAFAEYVLQTNSCALPAAAAAAALPLVTPVVTPRFVPSCSSELMHALGALSYRYKLPVQSHLSENSGEIEWVKNLHPDCASYTAVYEQHGLLTERSYFAHCVHCSGSERELLQCAGSSVIHCPSSNFSLNSGVCNVRQYLDEGIKVRAARNCLHLCLYVCTTYYNVVCDIAVCIVEVGVNLVVLCSASYSLA